MLVPCIQPMPLFTLYLCSCSGCSELHSPDVFYQCCICWSYYGYGTIMTCRTYRTFPFVHVLANSCDGDTVHLPATERSGHTMGRCITGSHIPPGVHSHQMTSTTLSTLVVQCYTGFISEGKELGAIAHNSPGPSNYCLFAHSQKLCRLGSIF